MKIAFTMTEGKGDLDQVLFQFATTQEAAGRKVCGVVQVNTDRADCVKCDMDVRVMPEGPTIRISQDLGKESRGCRLDVDALETAVVAVEKQISQDAELLVINKFGKHEAGGRGFRNAIGQALELGVPVVCGVNALNRQAFEDFCGGAAVFVAPDPKALSDWFAS